jgi:arylsulfatase A-like enzyme
MAITGPTHATLFTSLSPTAIGMERNGIPLDTRPPVLAELLADRGYDTAAFVSSYVISHRFGFDRGFAHFDDDFSDSRGTFRQNRWENLAVEGGFDRRAAETNDRLLDWLEARESERPLFLWVHYFDPHWPYSPPAPYDALYLAGQQGLEREIALYDAEIRYTDDQLRRLVEALDVALGGAERTLLWVTADHGEGLMDHGWPEHGPLLYEEDLRVPHVVRSPGRVAAGGVVRAPTTSADLVPTVLELLGVPTAELTLQGQSLAGALTAGSALSPERPIHFKRRHYESGTVSQRPYTNARGRVRITLAGDKIGVRAGRWKWIEAPDEGTSELYDLEADPEERNNVAEEQPDVAASLSELVATWHAEQRAVAPPAPEIEPEVLEQLEALGYAR